MIDIHTHILPGLDDGAVSLEETLKIAKEAVVRGFTGMIATPHAHNGVYLNMPGGIIESVDYIQQVLHRENVPLIIYPGAEISIHYALLENLKDKKLITLCNTNKYLLIELPDTCIPVYTDYLFNELQREGYTIIIAHPERNKMIQENPAHLSRWVQNGIFAQVTAGSLWGYWGSRIYRTAKLLVKSGMVQLMASDIHHAGSDSYRLAQAYQLLGRWTCQDTVKIFQDNARNIIKGKPLSFF